MKATKKKTMSGLNRNVHLAFGAAILILLAVGAISYRGIVVSNASDLWVRHTHEVLENLKDMALATEAIKANAGGFVLTGKESYIEAYRGSRAKEELDIAGVRNLTVDNPTQQRRISELERLAVQQVELSERIVDLRRTKGFEAAVEVVHGGEGKRITDTFQVIVHEMENEELRLLALRNQDAASRLAQNKTLLVFGTLLGLMIVAAASWSVQRGSSRGVLATEALRESEERYQLLLDGVRGYAIFMLDPQGQVISWNAGAERIKGYRAEEIIGHNFSCFYPPADIQRGKPEEMLRMTAESGWHEIQGMRVRKDGTRFLANISLTALRDSAGELRGFSEISRDLSASKESEARYRGLLEAAPDAMVVVNQSGEIVLLNAQAEKQFGYRRDELLEQKVTNIIPEGFAERLIADGNRTAAEALAQQIGTGIELVGRRNDGSEFPIEIMLSPLESAEGILVTAAVRDISVRRAAEKHLAQMEGRYRGLLEAAPDAMVVVNQSGEIVLLNAQAEKQFGYRRDELLEQKVTNIIPEGFAERLIADGTRTAAEALAQQIGTGIELIGRRNDGSEFPIEIMLSPLESAEGILVTAAIRDISVRRAAEKHLAQMEGRYRGLLEAAPDAMVVVNQSGEIVLLNAQAEKQFGYRRDELLEQKVTNIIPEGFAERLIADGTRTAAEALAQQIGTGIELIGRRKDGSEFPIEIMLSPLESAEGILVTAAVRDISVRRAAEKHLAQMEGRYRGLLEAAPDAMVVVNQSGEIALLNVQAEKQFGYRRDELLGQKVTNIIPEGFAERLIADGTRTAAEALAQQIGTGIELIGRRKDGSEFPIEIMLSPLESANGILVTAAVRDISMRKIAEAHLVKTVADLKRSNDELQQFAYVASHDLQEPLRTVASFTQLLAKRYQGKLDADADEFIGYAVDGCNRMKALIQDLLVYSRTGAEGKALAEISGENALQRATQALEMVIQESGAVVTHDLLPTITTDLGQLTQVFQNLVGNAIKYRGVETPQVHVSARQNGGNEWIFSVRDNGLGIEPQYFEKIFVIFQRLHGREEFAGTGIGLSICKKIVERLGGRIWVESQIKKGSTFYFALPERNGK